MERNKRYLKQARRMINIEELEMERRRDKDFVEDLTQMDWAEQLQW